MKSLKSLLLVMVALNIIAVITIYHYGTNISSSHQPKVSTLISQPDFEYKFINPIRAFHILEQLDIVDPIPDHHYNNKEDIGPTPDDPYLGMVKNERYCSYVRKYFVNHPEVNFLEVNYFTDYIYYSLMRETVLPMIGVDTFQLNSEGMPKEIRSSQIYNFATDLNLYFTNSDPTARFELGKSIACQTQAYNHVLGDGSINRKDMVGMSLEMYYRKYNDRQHCFTFDKFFPKTWVMLDKEQCLDFFLNYFNTPEYKELKDKYKIVYIRKVGFGSHKAEGVQPVDDEEEELLRNDYENGRDCGVYSENFVIQKYIPNSLLLLNHKFDFRVYMLIASVNPMIVYYHDGFLRLSLYEYDPNSHDKKVLLTNTDLSGKAFEEAKAGKLINGMNETELRNFQMWNFSKLENHLNEIGKIDDKNWIANYLRPQMKKAMIHLNRAAAYEFYKFSPSFEFFGVDFMLDDDLVLWFLEVNSSPVIKGTSEEKEIFLLKMLKDLFEINMAYLKSRTKRIIRFVNELTQEIQGDSFLGDNTIPNYDERLAEYRKITQNYLEPEFELSKDNSFEIIIDENLKGADQFFGYIDDECV